MELIDNLKPKMFEPFTNIPLYSAQQVEDVVKLAINIAVKEAMTKLYNDNIVKPRLTIEEIKYDELAFFLKLASQLTGFTVDVIKSKSRNRPILRARFIYYILARFYTNFSYAEIGNLVSRDHASVGNSINTHASKRYAIGNEVEILIKDKFDSNFDIEEAYVKGRNHSNDINFE